MNSSPALQNASGVLADARMLIDGVLVEGDNKMDVINPATAQAFARAPDCTADELDQALAAARKAFPAWRDRPLNERRDIVRQMAARIASEIASLAEVLTAEQGKPLAAAADEIRVLIHFLERQAEFEIPVIVNEDSPARLSRTYRVPIGVVAALAPWNFPVLLAWWKVVPALLTGNVVVLKPAGQTPLAVLRIGELVADLFPRGVLTVVCGSEGLGPRLTAHPEVDKISFTGSTQAGRRVMASAAESLKRLTLELGGNDPAIVFDDVDVAKTARKVFWAAFANAGQICVAAKRIYVHQTIYDAFLDALTTYAAKVKVGDGSEAGSMIGPLQNRRQFETVQDLLRDCRAKGYDFRFEGEAPPGPGYFVPVTIIDNPPDEARIVAEEQFGPVLPVMRFEHEDEVIARANASPFGLGASIWTEDMERAERLSHRLDAGTVWVNEASYLSPYAAFGGRKQSGVGAEHGEDAVHAVTEPRTTVMRRA